VTAVDAPNGPRAPGGLAVVTGTGFVASHLIRRLQAAGTEVVVVTRQAGDFGDRTITCPLTELTPQVWEEAGVQQIETLYHLAAFIPKTGAEANDVQGAYTGNLLGTRALLDSVVGRLARVVFTSTIDVYAPGARGPLDEHAFTRPGTLYGSSKLFCESLIRVWADTEGCEHAVVRLGHLYGPGEEAFRKLVPETIRRLLRGESPIVYGDGSTLADLLHVDDAVEALVRTGERGRPIPDPLNVVGASAPVSEIVDLLIAATGQSDITMHRVDGQTPPSIEFDDRRMREALGAWKRVGLEEGLRQEVEYMVQPLEASSDV
jgi:UDP-glucose 4-epimerase